MGDAGGQLEHTGLGASDEGGGFILDPHKPPGSQPSLWLQWVPTADGRGIRWDGGEDFAEVRARGVAL